MRRLEPTERYMNKILSSTSRCFFQFLIVILFFRVTDRRYNAPIALCSTFQISASQGSCYPAHPLINKRQQKSEDTAQPNRASGAFAKTNRRWLFRAAALLL